MGAYLPQETPRIDAGPMGIEGWIDAKERPRGRTGPWDVLLPGPPKAGDGAGEGRIGSGALTAMGELGTLEILLYRGSRQQNADFPQYKRQILEMFLPLSWPCGTLMPKTFTRDRRVP